MEDYKEIIKEMLLRDFSPNIPLNSSLKGEAYKQGNVIKMTTAQVLQMVQGVIPYTPIDEHDVFDSLKECGFEYKLVGFQHITDDEELISYGYRWVLWKKEVNL